MHFRGNFKRFLKGHRFIVKYREIKNICYIGKRHKNPRNP